MVRLVSVALLMAAVETPGWSQSASPAPKAFSPEAWRISEIAIPNRNDTDTAMFGGTDVSLNSRLGFGVFGLKRDPTALPPVTVYEVNSRPSRKPGLGFRLKF